MRPFSAILSSTARAIREEVLENFSVVGLYIEFANMANDSIICTDYGLCESMMVHYQIGKTGSVGAPEVHSVINSLFTASLYYFVGLRPVVGLAAWLAFAPLVSAVSCPHCKDTITGCGGGDACPLGKDLADSAAIFISGSMAKSPKITHLLSPNISAHFTRPVVDAVVGLACAPAVGTEIDFESGEYTSCRAVVQAAMHDHCSVAEAENVLTGRMDAAAGEDMDATISRIKRAMDMLKLGVTMSRPPAKGRSRFCGLRAPTLSASAVMVSFGWRWDPRLVPQL